MSSATDALLKAAKAMVDDPLAVFPITQYKALLAKQSALARAVREVEDENRKGPQGPS